MFQVKYISLWHFLPGSRLWYVMLDSTIPWFSGIVLTAMVALGLKLRGSHPPQFPVIPLTHYFSPSRTCVTPLISFIILPCNHFPSPLITIMYLYVTLKQPNLYSDLPPLSFLTPPDSFPFNIDATFLFKIIMDLHDDPLISSSTWQNFPSSTSQNHPPPKNPPSLKIKEEIKVLGSYLNPLIYQCMWSYKTQ